MAISSRFFEAGTTYRLCVFQVNEGDEWAPPDGTQVVHVEPIEVEGSLEGMYIWALVPGSKMAEAIGGSDDDR